MGSNYMVAAHKIHQPVYVYNRCPTSPISNVFEVPIGHYGLAQLYAAPEGYCVEFEEELCPSGCELEYFPLTNDCDDPVSMQTGCDGDQRICLTPGRYRAILTDDDGDPYTPAINEVVLKVDFIHGVAPDKAA